MVNMDKNDLKKLLKPLIKECLTEILMEEGLMKIVKENVQREPIQEKQASYERQEQQFIKDNTQNKKISLQEAKTKLLKEIGINGFDPFAGSIPPADDETGIIEEDILPEKKLMPGIQGSGVDISRLMGANKQAWNFYNNALTKGKKEQE